MAESEEYFRALRANLTKITKSVEGSGAENVGKVATQLYEVELIESADLQSVLEPCGVPLATTVTKMFKIVLMKLENAPNKEGNYEKLLKVLRSNNFGYLAELLEKSRIGETG